MAIKPVTKQEALDYLTKAGAERINEAAITSAARIITAEREEKERIAQAKARQEAEQKAARQKAVAAQERANTLWARLFSDFPQVARTKEHIKAIHQHVKRNDYESLLEAFDTAASEGQITLDSSKVSGLEHLGSAKFQGPQGLTSQDWFRLTSPVHKVANAPVVPSNSTYQDRGGKSADLIAVTGGKGNIVPSLIEGEAYNWIPTLAAKVQSMTALQQAEYFSRHPQHRKIADGEQKLKEVTREDAIRFLKDQGLTSATQEQITKTVLALAKKL